MGKDNLMVLRFSLNKNWLANCFDFDYDKYFDQQCFGEPSGDLRTRNELGLS